MSGKLSCKLKMNMLYAPSCIEWLNDLTELVLCCLLTVGNNATSVPEARNVTKRKVRQASLVIFFPQGIAKKERFAFSLTVARKPNERSLTSEHCQPQTQSQQGNILNENGENRKPIKTVSVGVQVERKHGLLLRPQSCLPSHFRIEREFKTKHGKVHNWTGPWESVQGAKVPQLLLAWPWIDARQSDHSAITQQLFQGNMARTSFQKTSITTYHHTPCRSMPTTLWQGPSPNHWRSGHHKASFFSGLKCKSCGTDVKLANHAHWQACQTELRA